MPFGKPKTRAPEASGAPGDETALTDVLDFLRARGVLDLPWSDDAGVRAHYQDSYEVAENMLQHLRWRHPRNPHIPRSQSKRPGSCVLRACVRPRAWTRCTLCAPTRARDARDIQSKCRDVGLATQMPKSSGGPLTSWRVPQRGDGLPFGARAVRFRAT